MMSARCTKALPGCQRQGGGRKLASSGAYRSPAQHFNFTRHLMRGIPRT
jgi:hypothetical protein